MEFLSIFRFCILVGSARINGNSQGISKWVHNELQLFVNNWNNSQYDIVVVDPHTRPHPVNPVLDSISPAAIKDPANYASQEVREWSQFIDTCSGMILVTPEYNGGYPSSLKNALDVIFWEWKGKPAAVVSLGGHGGRKAHDQLRQVMTTLQMDIVQQRVEIAIPNAYTYTSQRVIPSEEQDTFLVQYKNTLCLAFQQLIDKMVLRNKPVIG